MDVSEDAFLQEKAEIEAVYQSLKLGQVFRQTALACISKWSGGLKYPFNVDPHLLPTRQRICFGDCLNINFERGPKLSDLGEVEEGFIPKKFIWGESLKPVGYVEPVEDEDEEEGEGEEGGDDDE